MDEKFNRAKKNHFITINQINPQRSAKLKIDVSKDLKFMDEFLIVASSWHNSNYAHQIIGKTKEVI